MNYLMFTILGISMAANQPHEITGKMVDLDTGEIILVFPEKENQERLNYEALNVWGKEKFDENKYNYSENSKESVTSKINSYNNQSQKESISCSSDGNCDGSVSLEKSTSNN